MINKKLPQPRFTIRLNDDRRFEPIPYRPFVFSKPFKLDSGTTNHSKEYYSLLLKEKHAFISEHNNYNKRALISKLSYLIVEPILKHLIRICTFHIIELQNVWRDEIVETMIKLLTYKESDTKMNEINLMKDSIDTYLDCLLPLEIEDVPPLGDYDFSLHLFAEAIEDAGINPEKFDTVGIMAQYREIIFDVIRNMKTIPAELYIRNNNDKRFKNYLTEILDSFIAQCNAVDNSKFVPKNIDIPSIQNNSRPLEWICDIAIEHYWYSRECEKRFAPFFKYLARVCMYNNPNARSHYRHALIKLVSPLLDFKLIDDNARQTRKRCAFNENFTTSDLGDNFEEYEKRQELFEEALYCDGYVVSKEVYYLKLSDDDKAKVEAVVLSNKSRIVKVFERLRRINLPYYYAELCSIIDDFIDNR